MTLHPASAVAQVGVARNRPLYYGTYTTDVTEILGGAN